MLSWMSGILGFRSQAHRVAHQYWKDCSCTFLAADPTYYDRQESTLREMLSNINVSREAALDVGCGNGRFSLVIGDYVRSVLAFDLSKTLIDEATVAATQAEASNVSFQCRNLEEGFPAGTFGLVSCMGVTSTIIDDNIFNGLVKQLYRSIAHNGYLITKDSLGAEFDKAITTGSYITIYRSAARYESKIVQTGFKLVQKTELVNAGDLVNRIYLWKKI